MKQLIVSVSISLLALAAGCASSPRGAASSGEKKAPENEYVVIELQGVNVRAEADKSSKKVGFLTFGKRVEALETGPEETLYGRKAPWLRVRGKDMEGWTFGGFLLKNESGAIDITDSASDPGVDENKPGRKGMVFKTGKCVSGDCRNKKGAMTWIEAWNDVRKYNGEWKDGIITGRGVWRKETCDIDRGEGSCLSYDIYIEEYSGQFLNGRFHGEGSYSYIHEGVTDKKVVGEWKKGMLNGNAELSAHGGDSYSGEWKNDEYHGYGKLSHDDFIDGNWRVVSMYAGDFAKGKKHGWGAYCEKGYIYVGGWLNDKCHGLGTYVDPKGARYVGEYKENHFHGRGTYTYSDGKKYTGEFANDKAHGMGTLYNLQGNVLKQGRWENNIFVGEK